MARKSTAPRGYKVTKARSPGVHVARTPNPQPLLHAVDNGPTVCVDPSPYISGGRDPGWGPHLDGFLSRNREALAAIGAEPLVVAGRNGIRLELKPGHSAGAVPLRSPVSGQVAGGFVVSPRFGWPGVGRVLAATGWGSGPQFLTQPLVPGSGREVPPWVLAGPVLQRLTDLLSHLKPGYQERIEVRTHPRGQIQWPTYIAKQMATGRWHHLPCKFSELGTDSRLRQTIRWTLERIRLDLAATGGSDPMALILATLAMHLLDQVADVPSRRPYRGELERNLGAGPLTSAVVREGLRAISWIVDERGLGGGRSSDGLAWTLQLETLWERYVEKFARSDAALSGGRVRVGRLGETTVPLPWDHRSHRAIGHLIPDIIVETPNGIEIIDAKYKAHFADLDVAGWNAFTEDAKESLRADVHQVLAYAAVCGDVANIKATLVYPVSVGLYDELQLRSQHIVSASIPVGTRLKQLRLRALPFAGLN